MHPDLEKLLDLQSKDNALKAVDVRQLEMPYSPERVWRAIHHR